MRKKLADMPVNTFASCKAWRRNSFDWSCFNVELAGASMSSTRWLSDGIAEAKRNQKCFA